MRSDGDQLATSTFSLVLKHGSQHPPGCIGNGKGHTMVPYHVGRFQIFNYNGLIGLHIVMTRFMQRIFALVRNAIMVSCNDLFGFLASVTPLLALGKPPLGMSKVLCALLGVFGIVDDLPSAVCDQIAYPHIQPNRILLVRQGARRCFTDTLQIPARGTHDHTREFERAFKRTMYYDPNMPPTVSR